MRRREEWERQKQHRKEESEHEVQCRKEDLEAVRLREERDITMCRLQDQELVQQQLEWQKSCDTRERDRQHALAAQVKFFVDV